MISTHLALLRFRQVCKVLQNGEWLFMGQDVVEALAGSADARKYIKKMRSRDSQVTEGEFHKQECANTLGLLRIIQKIPSPPSYKLFDLVKVERATNDGPARSFEDYGILVNEAALPFGVTLLRKV